MQKNKIELIIYKNYNKTNNNLAVHTDITYEKLEVKLRHFTQKMFEIQIQTKQGQEFERLSPSNLYQHLQNYKGEKINMITFDESQINSNKSTNIEHKEPGKIPSQSIKKQKSNPKIMSSLKESQEKVQIFSKKKQQKKINRSQLSYNQSVSMIQSKQEIKQRLTLVYQQCEKISLQMIYGKNHQKQHQKKICCQCKKDIVATYYVCLMCPISIIICSSCQAKDIIEAHNFKGHALGKIKRWTQQITSKKSSIQDEDYQQINKHIQQKIEQIIKKKLMGKSKLRDS